MFQSLYYTLYGFLNNAILLYSILKLWWKGENLKGVGYSPHNSPHTTAATASSAVEEPEQFSSLVPFVLVVFFVYNTSFIT